VREAIIQLGDRELEAIGLDGIVAATRDAGPRDVTELVCHGAGGILQVRVEEPIPGADLDRLGSVRWWERLTAPASGVTYLCKIEPTNDPEEPVLDEHATAHEVSAVREDGIDLSVVGSQDGIGRSVAAIDEAGMSPLLCRLTDYEGPPSAIDSPTERQREVVETAHSMGYYEVPRGASTDDVAEAVGLDPSTVAEHLRRAERSPLGQLLDAPNP